MYKIKKVAPIIFLLLFVTIQSQAQAPDTAWTRIYGGGSWDQGLSVQETYDGGYIITGYTYSFGSGGDVYLIKTDSTGDSLWARTYGGSGFDLGYSVQQTTDSGYIIGGYTNSFGAGGFDLYLIKTDTVGDTAWTRTFGRGDYDHGYSARQTSDGGYIITGDISIGYQEDIYIVKTDSMGDSLWAKIYGGSENDVGFCIRETSNGGYIVGAYTASYGAGNYDIYLIKTDSMGDSLWAKTYGGSEDDYLEELQITNDGGYIIAGYTESFGGVNFDAYLIKTDSTGDSLWARTFGEDYYDYFSSVWQTTDGGYVSAGGTGSFGVGYPQVYIVKIDSLGDSLWSKFVGGDNEDNGSSVQQTSDGGYIITGSKETGTGDGNLYIIKLEPFREINITSPNGGEDWEAGSTHDIIWTSTNTSGAVNIMYSVNNGLDWTGIISGTPDDGIHPWTVPDTVSDSCLISIADTNGSVSDTSDSVFTISSLPPQIVSVNPVQNALNISKDTNISVTFDQDMSASTINESTFIVHSLSTGLHSGFYSYDPVTNTAEFDPDNNFAVGEIVSVFLTTGIEDAVGDTLTNPYAWSFTVEVDGGTGTFAEKVDYDVGGEPFSVFCSDLDSDGDMDMAVVNTVSDNISVLLNNGDGTFAEKVDYSVGDRPWTVISADLDSDGDMDLAVTNYYSNSVSILMNNGDGTFADEVNYATGNSPSFVFSSDLDSDGDMDLAVTNWVSDNVSILLNNGDGTFATKVDYSTGNGPSSIFSSDLDSDGDMDLSVANYDTTTISVLFNNGDGTFAGKVDYSTEELPHSIFSTDLDSDGDMDLAVGNDYSNNVSILLNNGDGTFAPKVDYGTGNTPTSVFSTDLDSDGDMDLALTNIGSDDISVLLNSGNGTFASKVDYGAGDGPFLVFSSDLDSDGDMDLAVANWFSDNVSILLNNNSSVIPTPDLPKTYSMSVKAISIDNKLEVRYTLPAKASVNFNLYDILGVNIKKLTEEKPAGFHLIEIDMRNKPKGVYFIRMEADGKKFVKTNKFVLM